MTRFADMFSALGMELGFRITRLLLKAHPGGIVAGDINTRAWLYRLHALAASGQVEKRGFDKGPA